MSAEQDEFLGGFDAPEEELPPPDINPDLEAAQLEAAPKPEPEAKPEPERIPLASMLAERAKHRQDIELERAERTKLEARLRELEAKLPKPEEPKDPDYLEDPKGYADAQAKKVLDKTEALEKEVKETREQLAARESFEKFQTTVQSSVQEFHGKQPDYFDAIEHVRSVRMQQLALLHPEAQPTEIAQHIIREELQAAHQLLQAGKNPAEFAYHYAKTLGYTPKQASQPETPAAPLRAPQQQNPRARQAAGTLGASSGGGAVPDDGMGDAMDLFDQARAERFRR